MNNSLVNLWRQAGGRRKSIVEKTHGKVSAVSLEWEREGMLDGDSGDDDSADLAWAAWWECEADRWWWG